MQDRICLNHYGLLRSAIKGGVMSMEDCLSCDIISGKINPPGGIIYSDDYWMVDHSVSPIRLAGFLIIKPIYNENSSYRIWKNG